MEDLRREIQHVQSNHTKDALWERLEDELGGEYAGTLPTNLNTGFMRSCYTRIAPNEDPHDRLRAYHDAYSEQWVRENSEKVQLATALKLLLSERVGRAESNVISGTTNELLAELIVAMRTAPEENADRWQTDEDRQARLDAAPARRALPASPFEDGLSFDEAVTDELDRWLASRGESRGTHAVYVLDCTPPTGGGENSKIRSARGRVVLDATADVSWRAALEALNNGMRLFYVGYASNLKERLRQHANKPAGGGGDFTATFQPRELVEVTWYETQAEALAAEGKQARELSESEVAYAYSERK